MGSVEAVAEEMSDGTTRVVALKRLLRTTGTEAARLEMFLREARLTTLLEHPNVIRSFEYGESAGEVFLAMEYVAGEPLSRLLAVAAERHEGLPLPVIAYILAEACEGLHAAHELRGANGESLGVVHRDVSPHNVMVGYDGSVKLLDFGVAKIDLIDCVARTKTGEVKGKTAYMSPEQAMGEPLDRRSDLYSMGAVLFECVAGRRMWVRGRTSTSCGGWRSRIHRGWARSSRRSRRRSPRCTHGSSSATPRSARTPRASWPSSCAGTPRSPGPGPPSTPPCCARRWPGSSTASASDARRPSSARWQQSSKAMRSRREPASRAPSS